VRVYEPGTHPAVVAAALPLCNALQSQATAWQPLLPVAPHSDDPNTTEESASCTHMYIHSAVHIFENDGNNSAMYFTANGALQDLHKSSVYKRSSRTHFGNVSMYNHSALGKKTSASMKKPSNHHKTLVIYGKGQHHFHRCVLYLSANAKDSNKTSNTEPIKYKLAVK